MSGRLARQRPRPSGWIDLMEILVKDSRKGSCTYRMDGARKIDAAKAHRKAGAMKAAALLIKLYISRIESNIHV